VLLVVLVAGVVRHRLPAALAGLGVVVASVATTEAAQRLVLRPVLLDSGTRREDQSFPSGHAAVALSTMCALLLVTPPRWRAPVALVASAWALAITVATVVANWHRPSDTVGSGLIVVGYTAAAVVLLARAGAAHPLDEPTTPVLRPVCAALAGLATIVAVVAAAAGGPLLAGRAIAAASAFAVTAASLSLVAPLSFERKGTFLP
jgi:membrane-associated phospholipid phosphatase